jgi:predicted MPP superfamily phosphohydrolase
MGVTNSAGTIAQLKLLSEADKAGAVTTPVPFILHVGDISYADDRPSSEYEKIWDEWFDDMQPIHAHLPYMVLPGNHEHESGKPDLPYSKYFIEFNYRFFMPLNTNNYSIPYYDHPHNMYWSFDHQNVHIIAVSTETGFPGSQFADDFGDMLTWLENDLKQAVANRANVPWIIAMGHRPLYSSADSSYIIEYLAPVQKAFEDLFHTYKVDLYLCGHVHAYERSWPMYKGKVTQKSYVNPTGLVELDAGAAGCIEGLSNTWISPIPEWSAKRYGSSESYGILTVKSNEELDWVVYRSSDDAVVDSITLTQTRAKK